ncbi:MAG: ABC transporter ATP-binding protein [Bacteroidales bacterium]|nr:ABC transporter ATP-binding protein [Lachnoclostridium sp.]MCM1383225.1 ABC transporter ATP-binding protein [Lachnoclostridium sp.]MCM1464550.1 ABC transporter ATP-binding protein [Bacteroidales bacterium]
MVKVQNAVKNYKNFHLKCSMEALPGRVTGIVGQNGAGKSTLFKLILGLISLDGGAIEILETDSRKFKKPDKQKIGVVLPDSGFSEYFTIKDMIPILDSFYDRFQKERFLELCERFALPLNKQTKEFSTGMKTKLKIIIATTHDASLLILDEPTVGMDVIARGECFEILREFMEAREENAILISSHISSDLEGICDELYMIHGGEIIFHEDVDALLGEYGILKVDAEQYEKLDKTYLLKVKQETYGYRCLTGQRQFYLENYPEIAIEKGNIDELIVLMILSQGSQGTER